MKYPKLKNALLCRIIPYVLVIGGFILPIIIVALLPFVPPSVKVIFAVVMIIGLVVYIFKNMVFLMIVDVELAKLHCYNTARTQFNLDDIIGIDKIEKRLSCFGKDCAPMLIEPTPDVLRYKFNSSMTVNSSGIENVIMIYHTDVLTEDVCRSIFDSAKTNSKALTGKKKARLLDKNQKKAPLNRVTVPVIFAGRVDSDFSSKLYDTLCEQDEDGLENSFLPCVIDVSRRVCTFNSLRIPYVGGIYPVKNRGVRIIRKLIFGGKLPLGDEINMPKFDLDINPDESFWSYWRSRKNEIRLSEEEDKERFEGMHHKQFVFLDQELLYIKWEESGLLTAVDLDESTKTATVDPLECWIYPKVNEIEKSTVAQIEAEIRTYFSELGYTCEFTRE